MTVETLNIIIHEEAVQAYADTGESEAIRVSQEIKEIKKTNHLSIPSDWSPFRLHPEMPPVSNCPLVVVSGGFALSCGALQLFTLKEAGYNAHFHPTAVYKSDGSTIPESLYDEIIEKYPDFFDEVS